MIAFSIKWSLKLDQLWGEVKWGATWGEVEWFDNSALTAGRPSSGCSTALPRLLSLRDWEGEEGRDWFLIQPAGSGASLLTIWWLSGSSVVTSLSLYVTMVWSTVPQQQTTTLSPHHCGVTKTVLDCPTVLLSEMSHCLSRSAVTPTLPAHWLWLSGSWEFPAEPGRTVWPGTELNTPLLQTDWD